MKDKKGLFFGIVIVVIIVLLGCFLGTKLFSLAYYNIPSIDKEEYQTFVDRLQIKNKFVIEKEILNDSEYLSYNNVKIKNDFENFKVISNDDDHIKYGIYKDNKLETSFWFGGTITSLVEILRNDFEVYSSTNIEYFKLSTKERIEILDKNNIKTDMDLIEYLSNQTNINNNIFTSQEKIKENYFIKFITYLQLVIGENITLIDGDYKGYIINMGNIKETYIINEEEKYVFTFINTEYFNDEYIKELLNTIVIEDK